ncbi:Chlorophyllase type 0 [Linum perenne]
MAALSAFLFLLLVLIATPLISGTTLPVFKQGEFEVQSRNVKAGRSSTSSGPPRPLYLVAPTRPGKYPIFLFAHGTFLDSKLYSGILSHVASHGYIVVAPLLFDSMLFMPSQQEEIDYLAQVTNWLPKGLSSQLLDDVVPDFNHLAIGGHSRGGKSAFALALGYTLIPIHLTISALVGIDPVAGRSKNKRTDPQILTYQPESFDLSMPVAVIGTGLGNQSKPLGVLSCAPNKVNHVEFYNECRAPKSHLVPARFGHMDLVDDVNNPFDMNWMMTNLMCKSGSSWSNPRDEMRRTVGGIVVAFLNSCFYGKGDDYVTILKHPEVSPAVLQPPRYEFDSLANA